MHRQRGAGYSVVVCRLRTARTRLATKKRWPATPL